MDKSNKKKETVDLNKGKDVKRGKQNFVVLNLSALEETN